MTASKTRSLALALLAALLLLPGLASAAKKPRPKKETRAARPRDDAHTLAVVKTSMGDFTIRFFADKAPVTVRHFLDLASSGFYDGTLFHRVIPGFILQGGDPLTKLPARSGEWGTGGRVDAKGKSLLVKPEFNSTSHRRGIVSAAHTPNDPDSTTQFFVVLKDDPAMDGKWTAFGEVIQGMDVVDRIVSASNADTNDPRTGGTPRSPQKILKIDLVPDEQKTAAPGA